MVAAVMIGADPHKGSHTAVAIGAAEEPLGQVRVRAPAAQAERLPGWAAAWPQRTWAAGGAAGLGHLLDWQLVAAGERVLDVQPKLGARVRLLASGDTNNNDPGDARSVAIAALRSGACRPARPDDHATVLKVWAKRHRDLGRDPDPGRVPAARRAAGWSLAAFPRGSPQRTRPVSWNRSPCPVLPRKPARTWPAASWMTCAGSAPRCARPGRG